MLAWNSPSDQQHLQTGPSTDVFALALRLRDKILHVILREEAVAAGFRAEELAALTDGYSGKRRWHGLTGTRVPP